MMLQSLSQFFEDRWHCRLPSRRLFLLDILLTGTLLNILSGILALTLLNYRVNTVWVLAAHFALLPYNLFLVRSAWYSASASLALRAASFVWLLVMLYF